MTMLQVEGNSFCDKKVVLVFSRNAFLVSKLKPWDGNDGNCGAIAYKYCNRTERHYDRINHCN